MAYEAKSPREKMRLSPEHSRAPFLLRLIGFLKGARRFFSETVGLALAGAIELSDSNSRHLKNMLVAREVANLRGRQGMTPLLYALVRSKLYAVELLLMAGADPNAKADNGQGVMSMAAIHPDRQFLEMTLNFGGDPNTRDKLGMPILSRAVENHLPTHVDLLLRHNADVNAADAAGNSSLATAVTVGWADLIRPLLVAGADMDRKNEFGTSPRDIAYQTWQSPSLRRAFESALEGRQQAVDSEGFWR